MGYDRYDTRDTPRDERSRWSEDRNFDRERGRDRSGPDNRGFFERAGDEVASWFGDDDAERRRREDRVRDEREGGSGARASNYNRDYGQDRNRDRERGWGGDRDRSSGPGRYGSWNDNRGAFARGGSSDSDYNRGWRELSGSGDREPNRFQDQDRFGDRGRDYRPMTGDYGRNSSGRSDSEWDRDPYRSTSRAGTRDWSDRSRHEDPHYSSWRDRHLSELDRDYDDYRREHQSKFESDFGSWREKRQQKRGLLGMIREHMEVVGNDDEHG